MQAVIKATKDHTYPRGTSIFGVGDEQQGLYWVKKGLVEEFRINKDRCRLPINRVGPGKRLALASVEGYYCCFAEAVEDSIVGFLSFQTLEELCPRFPKMVVN